MRNVLTWDLRQVVHIYREQVRPHVTLTVKGNASYAFSQADPWTIAPARQQELADFGEDLTAADWQMVKELRRLFDEFSAYRGQGELEREEGLHPGVAVSPQSIVSHLRARYGFHELVFQFFDERNLPNIADAMEATADPLGSFQYDSRQTQAYLDHAMHKLGIALPTAL
jgi:hypothetical protein